MTKPTSVEVGQTWENPGNKQWGVATVVADLGAQFDLQWSGLDGRICTWRKDSILRNLAYLGGPQTAEVGPMMKEDSTDYPARRIGCGGEKANLPRSPRPHVPPQGLSGTEHRNINGVAMSALQFIQARKPPEPWIPSVDEYDLLPDAPGVLR